MRNVKPLRLALVLLLLPALAVPFLANGQEKPADGQLGEKYALLVGVKQYDKNELRNLDYAEPDVVELSKVLKKTGYRRVMLMTQTEGALNARVLPLAANIRLELKSLLEDRTEADTVLIAFAGHGVQFRDGDEHFFCPMDAKLKDKKTLVSLSEVYDELEKCRAQVKLLLVDACRNDPQSDFSRARAEIELESVTRPQKRPPPGGVAAIFSCSEGQKAYEDPDLKHGVFFHYVIEGLRNKADLDRDRSVNLDELTLFVKKRVPDHVKEVFGAEVRQTPESINKTRGSVALATVSPLDPRRDPRQVPPRGTRDKPLPPDGITNSIGMNLVPIKPGSFQMGSLKTEEGSVSSEQPRKEIRLTEPYYMGQTEVTQAEYETVMKGNPAHFQGKRDGPDYPVEQVTWYDAVEFCKRLSNLPEEVKAGRSYRLPTEAEWEYACRAGKETAFAYGNSLSSDRAACNGEMPYGKAERGNKFVRTNPVSKFPRNTWHLYDMHGNVYEWCQDFYDKNAYASMKSINPSGPPRGEDKVIRGGSFMNPPRMCRSASRYSQDPKKPDINIGFRVVATVKAGEEATAKQR